MPLQGEPLVFHNEPSAYEILISEVFAVVGLALFLPICLEQFARDNGLLLPEKTTRCSSGLGLSATEDGRCVIKVGWAWIDTASFRFDRQSIWRMQLLTTHSLYVYSTSVALQALTVISMGGIADHRKRSLSSHG